MNEPIDKSTNADNKALITKEPAHSDASLAAVNFFDEHDLAVAESFLKRIID